MSTVGDRIRHARKGLGMTQQELAESVGVTRNTVIKWESNRMTPRDRQVRNIATALNMQLTAFNCWGGRADNDVNLWVARLQCYSNQAPCTNGGD